MVYNQPYFISLRGDGPEFRGIASTMTGDGKHKPPIYGKMVKSWTWGLHRLNSCWSGRKFQRSYHFRDDFGYFHLIAIPDSRARMTIFFLDAANCNCYGQWMGGCAVVSLGGNRSLLSDLFWDWSLILGAMKKCAMRGNPSWEQTTCLMENQGTRIYTHLQYCNWWMYYWCI